MEKNSKKCKIKTNMENLVSLYEKICEIKNTVKFEEGEFEITYLFNIKRKIAEILSKPSCSSFLIILPGAGFNEKTKNYLFKKMKFFLKNNIGLCIFLLDGNPLFKNDNEFFYFIREKIAEIRGIINYIDKTLKVKNISILGISFGGILGFIISAIEKKINKCIFLTTGANLEFLTWRSLLRFYIKKDCKRKVCRKMHKIYKKFLSNNLYNEIKNLPRKCFLYDPLTYLERLKNKKILMINGLFDLIVPFYCALEVKKRLKNIKIIWYPGTHFTLRFFLPFMKKRILKFLKNESEIRN